MLAAGALVLILACSGIAYWLGRSSPATPAADTPAPLPPPKAEAIINVEPSLAVGAHVEALSAEGWQGATIKQVSGSQALIAYERSSLGEEHVDVRLLRKPEAELVTNAPPAPPLDRAPAAVTTPTAPTPPVTPPAPPLGPRSATAAAAIPPGTYTCDVDTRGIVTKGAPADGEGAQIALTLTLEIVSDRVYRAYGEDNDNYRYDPASGRIIWESGLLASEEKPAEYRADSKTIVTSMGGQALTCTLRR